MKVILDSNIIISDFRLKTPDWTLLLESSFNSNIELLIPQLVIEEVLNKFEERLRTAENRLNKELLVIKKLTDREIHTQITKIKTYLNDYTRYLLNELKTNKAKIIDYPKVSHKNLVQKAIKKKKPFNENEKGYRDALIWENVKENIPEIGTSAGNPELVFITNNKADFLDENLNLHPDLIIELEDESLDLEAIRTYPDLQSFTKEIKHLFFSQAKSFKKRLFDSVFEEFDLIDSISDYLDKELLNKELDESIRLPYFYQNPTVQHIENVKISRIDDVRKINSTNFWVDLIIEVELQIDFYVDKYEHYSREETYYNVEDSDWNEYVIWATEVMTIPLSMTIIIDNKLEMQSAQVNQNYVQHRNNSQTDI